MSLKRDSRISQLEAFDQLLGEDSEHNYHEYIASSHSHLIDNNHARSHIDTLEDNNYYNGEFGENTGHSPRSSNVGRRSLTFGVNLSDDYLEHAINQYNNSKSQTDLIRKMFSSGSYLLEIFGLNDRLNLHAIHLSNCIIKRQTEEHIESQIYVEIGRRDLKGFLRQLSQLLKHGRSIDTIRDSAGATLCHIAYLYGSYEIGRWLVRNYPLLGLKTYSSKYISYDKERTSTDIKMPYAGENILHITIIKRNHNEVRWLLDFYRDHHDSVPFGLERLLSTSVTGSFFRRGGTFYFGSYPLHFAVCTNDIAMFDLVLSYSSSITHVINESSPSAKLLRKYNCKMGPNSIFIRDIHGNTALHLCVLHNLLDMYRHIKAVAQSMIRKELTNKFADYIDKSNLNKNPTNIHRQQSSATSIFLLNRQRSSSSYSTAFALPGFLTRVLAPYTDAGTYAEENSAPFITLESLLYDGQHPKPCEDRSKIYLPTLPQKPYEVNPDLNEEWLDKQVQRVLSDRLILALNDDYLSPLTMAALGKGFDSTEEDEINKKSTLEFLINEQKVAKWVYGPVKATVLELEGLEIPFNPYRYDRPDLVKANSRTVIDILCILDSEKSIAIEDIKQIIETKWNRVGFPIFRFYGIISFLFVIVLTLILCLINHTPTTSDRWESQSIKTVTFLYPVACFLLIIMMYREIPALLACGVDYWGFRGGIRGAARFDKYARTIMVATFVLVCVNKAYNSKLGLGNNYTPDPTVTENAYNPQDYRLEKFALVACIMASYSYLYYALMGLDSSGPFVLTIYRIISKNIPYFLQFYVVILIGFAGALSLVTNNGNPNFHYGFWHLILVVWTLVRQTVNLGPSNDALNMENVPKDMIWLFDVLSTAYNILVVIVFLNLLIALISNTYASISEYNESLLLMEKYNILSAIERTFSKLERQHARNSYALSVEDKDEELRDPKTKLAKRYVFEYHVKIENWWEKPPEQSGEPGQKIKEKIILLIIDPQIDYFREDSPMRNDNAAACSQRISKFIRDNKDCIDEIFVTLNSRYRYHITSPSFWISVDKDESDEPNILEHPEPFTVITFDDIANSGSSKGKWTPSDRSEATLKWCQLYVSELERKKRPPLTIWPEHCMVGNRGNSVIPDINDALQDWARHRQKNVSYVSRGQAYRSEMHSALRAEVEDPKDPSTIFNDDFLLKLKLADKLLVCGFQGSHALNFTLRDIHKNWTSGESHIMLLEDATTLMPRYVALYDEVLKSCKQAGISIKISDEAIERGDVFVESQLLHVEDFTAQSWGYSN